MKNLLNWKLWGLLSLTLGLAPFSPEPHVWGKLKWVAGGAEGMVGEDWFDLALARDAVGVVFGEFGGWVGLEEIATVTQITPP